MNEDLIYSIKSTNVKTFLKDKYNNNNNTIEQMLNILTNQQHFEIRRKMKSRSKSKAIIEDIYKTNMENRKYNHQFIIAQLKRSSHIFIFKYHLSYLISSQLPMAENSIQHSVHALTQCENQNQWIGNLNISQRTFNPSSEDKLTNRIDSYMNREMLHQSKQRFRDRSKQSKDLRENRESKYFQVQEMNNKMIELNALKQSYGILKSENESLNLILRDKEALIEELRANIEEHESQKDKIDRYELFIEDRNSMVKQIEVEMESLSENYKHKEALLEESKSRIDQFMIKNRDYEGKVNVLSKELTKLMEQKDRLQSLLDESEKRFEDLREKYLIASRRTEQIPELQIKLKSAISINVELERRINQLIETNEKLKMDFSSKQLSQRRFNQLESDLRKCHAALDDKQAQMHQLKAFTQNCREELQTLREYKQSHAQDQNQLNLGIKQIRALKQQLQQLTVANSSLQKDINRMNEEQRKTAERNQKIDQLFKENKHLVAVSMEKINEVESLQHEINSLNCQIAALESEKDSLKVAIENLDNQNNELSKQMMEDKEIIEELETQIKQSEKDKIMLREDNQQSIQAIKRQKQQKSKLKHEISDLQRAIIGLQKTIQGKQADKSRMQMEIQNFTIKVQQYEFDISNYKKSVESFLSKQKERSSQFKQLQSQNHLFEERIKVLTQNISALKSHIDKLEKWKSAYMQFLDSFTKTNERMHENCQKLLGE